jgi:hypothetical protein
MQDNRSSLLVVLSSILLVLLLVLSGIWGYNYYSTKNSLTTTTTPPPKQQTAVETTKDSLQKIYSQTISSLDNTLDSTWSNADSLKGNLDIRLGEFYKLRSDISNILKNNPNAVDLGIARQKIGELQQKVEDLRNRNKDVEAENKRLYSLLQQISNAKKIEQPIRTASKTEVAETPTNNNTSAPGLFTASQLKLTALVGDGETTIAEDAEKLVGSFVVKNVGQLAGAEIIIVVTQPNGKVVKNSAWETGIFETKEEGRKMYSQKIKFDYNKGEVKRCNFSLTADKYLKGNYTLQIYHNGIMIANTVKTLS